MIREIVKAQSQRLIIDIPKEYVGKDLEVLVFSDSEIEKPIKGNKNQKIIDEFKKLTKKPIKIDPNINIVKLDEDMNDVLL